MKSPFIDSLLLSTVDIIKLINFSSLISRHPGRGLNTLPCQRHHRSLIVESVASSPCHPTGDHRRRHDHHSAPALLEMGLVDIGLILVLGVILGADASDAHVIPLGPSPPPFWPARARIYHLSTGPGCPAGECLGALLSGRGRVVV